MAGAVRTGDRDGQRLALLAAITGSFAAGHDATAANVGGPRRDRSSRRRQLVFRNGY